MAAIEDEKGNMVPKLKKSDTPGKITNPGEKKIVRFFDNKTGEAIADLIALKEENFEGLDKVEIFHPVYTWKKKTLTDFTAKELMIPVFSGGRQVYTSPSVMEIAAYHAKSFAAFNDGYKRILNPHIFKVDLSKKLYDLKQELINN